MCRLENFILLGDFNSEITENAMKEFCDTYNLKNLITEATCFKNPINSSSIDLILTNKIRSFQNTTILETGLSDDHKMVITILKTCVPKQTPTVIKYRDYRQMVNTLHKTFKMRSVVLLRIHVMTILNSLLRPF